VLTSPETVLLTALVGVLFAVGRTETLTSRAIPPVIGQQTLTAARPHVTSLAPDGWLVDAVCRCGRRADQAADSEKIVLVPGESGTVTPSVPRHAAWPAVGSPERHGPAETAPEIQLRSQIAASYLVTDLAPGTTVVSAHVGTAPLQPDGWDARWGLMEMAAAQRRDWTRRCPCRMAPVARLGQGSV
jgi:hypothetical protein